VHHKPDRAIDGVVCESFIEKTNSVPTAVNGDCGAGYDTCLNDGEQCLVE